MGNLADLLASAERVLADLHDRPMIGHSHDHHVMMVAEFVRDMLTQKPSRAVRHIGRIVEIDEIASSVWPEDARRVAADLLRHAEEASKP